MEKLKNYYLNMSIKKTYILMTLMTITLTLLLSLLVMYKLNQLRESYYHSKGISHTGSLIEAQDNEFLFVINEIPSPDIFGQILTLSIFLAPIIIFLLVITVSAYVFYHTKIRNPVNILTKGIQNIRSKNLDFSCDYAYKDELGQVISAFDTMRLELIENNKKMWRMIEGRQTLNAAFSHDVRTPITIIKGHLQLLLKLNQTKNKELINKEDLYHTISLSLNNVNKIEHYIETMESCNSIHDLQADIKTCSFPQLWNQLQSDYSLVPKDITIKWQEEAILASSSLETDLQLLSRVIHNIINNGLRYCHKEVLIQAKKNQNFLLLTVRDDGPGFDQISYKKAFQPFFTREVSKEHKGMGLYISDAIIKKLSGKIWIDQTCQWGKLCIRLPLNPGGTYENENTQRKKHP